MPALYNIYLINRMWFKNLTLYRFTETFNLNAASLQQKLEKLPFRPCGTHELFSYGWTSPQAQNPTQLVHDSNGFLLLCAKKQEKVLPTAVINELASERIQETEQQQTRKLANKEKTEIKEQIIFELLPKAFTFSKRTFAYIDPKGGWIIVDSASAKKAEELLSHLRKTLGSLPLVPLHSAENPASVMTRWLLGNHVPGDLCIEDECELRSQEETAAIIRCKRHDLTLPEIKNHLDNGKQVSKLALSWADRLAFILDDQLAVKRLRFLDLIQDQVAEFEASDAAAQFDADFSIMSMELAGFLPRLLELFGGESQANG